MTGLGIVYDDGFLAIRGTTDSLAFAGEIDRRVCPVLRRVLDALPTDSGTGIHRDMGAVTYCDTDALGALVYPAAANGSGDARRELRRFAAGQAAAHRLPEAEP